MTSDPTTPTTDEQRRVAALEAELDRARHAIGALQRLAFALKELVPRAFEEGFNRRVPDAVEPWLVDWLQSDSKRALDPLLRGGAGPAHAGRAPGAPDAD